MNLRCKHCQPARRSLTALYRAIQRQEGTGAPPPPPDVSLRGAKRRGNLAVHSWITGRPRRKRNCLPEIATAPLGPRNDKSGAFAILTAACTDCKCAAGPGCPLPYNAAGSGAVSAGHPTADRQNSYSGRRACSVSRTVSASRGVYSSSPSGHSRTIDTLRRL